MKYIVMECNLSYAVVLDEAGRFLKVANMHYELGQTVTNVIEMEIPETAPVEDKTVKKKSKKWIYSLVAMAAALMLIVSSALQTSLTTYATVYIAINPEVRIDVNKAEKVLSLEGLNTDGKILVSDYEYKKKELELVMDELVDRAVEMGYLHEGGKITFNFESDNDEWVESRSQSLMTHVDDRIKDTLQINIEVEDKNAPPKVIIPINGDDSDYGPNNDGVTDYDNTDYGPNNDGVTDYNPPAPSPAPAPAPVQYNNSDYSDYGDSGYSDHGDSDYD